MPERDDAKRAAEERGSSDPKTAVFERTIELCDLPGHYPTPRSKTVILGNQGVGEVYISFETNGRNGEGGVNLREPIRIRIMEPKVSIDGPYVKGYFDMVQDLQGNWVLNKAVDTKRRGYRFLTDSDPRVPATDADALDILQAFERAV